MSKFVQKTLQSINTVLNNSGMFYAEKDKFLNNKNLDFSTFVSKIKNSETKYEEEEIVNQYCTRMMKRLSEPDITNAEIEEIVKLCMVCETMGYKTEFVYVHSLKLAQKGNYQQKHTGYLAAEFLLHPQHELVILLINTIQRDLTSSNHLEVILALTSICHLIGCDTVHNVMHLVEEKLQHPMSSVRKCAVLTLAHCLELSDSESAYRIAFPKLEMALSDPELEVVSVVVPTIHKVIKKFPGDFSYLLDSLIQLLEQILMRRIPHTMNYSDTPAPWLQIEILKLFKYLCSTSENSAKLAPVLKKTLAQTGLYHTIIQAITYQVIETIACIEADSELLEAATSSVSFLLKSRDVNMKLTGLEALVLIMKKVEPNITTSQQEIIIDCLKLPDETLQLKTLELMYHLANPSNVQAICKKMIEFLDQMKDDQKKRNLAMRILALAERFLNQSGWFISVIHSVLMKADHLVTSSDIFKIINVIMKDDDLKKIIKEDFEKLLAQSEFVPSSLVKVYCSVASSPTEFSCILPLLETVTEDCASWILVCLMESILKCQTVPPNFLDMLRKFETKYENSFSLLIVLQQLLQIIENISNIERLDTDVEIDPSLTFLDSYVLQDLTKSDNVYLPPSLRVTSFVADRSPSENTSQSFCIMNAETSSENYGSCFTLKSPAYSTFSSPSVSFQSLSSDIDVSSPSNRKKTVWTKEGRSKVSCPEDNIDEARKDDKEYLELFAGIT